MVELSNKELVISNSQGLSFLICKIAIILHSFSYSEDDEMKKNRLQRLVQSLTWIAPLRRHKYLCFVLWIFVLFLVDFFYYYYYTVKLFSFFFCFVGV